MAHRTSIIRWTEQITVSFSGLLSANINTLAQILTEITRNLSAKLVGAELSYGINDDPTDERIFFMIGLGDPNGLPSVANIEWSDWLKTVQWRSIGTDSGPVKVMENFESNDLDRQYSNPDDDDGPMAVVASVQSNTTSTVQFRGKVTFEFAYRQHTYNDFKANPTASMEVVQWLWE